jgi:hypothetical protein
MKPYTTCAQKHSMDKETKDQTTTNFIKMEVVSVLSEM